jgi:hypothetical protein
VTGVQTRSWRSARRLIAPGLGLVLMATVMTACTASGPPAVMTGDLPVGSVHKLFEDGRPIMPMPRLGRDITVTKQANGSTKVSFGFDYAVANTYTTAHVKADEAIVNVSVARYMGPTGPQNIDPEFSKTFVDDHLDHPSTERTYSVTLPASVTSFLDANGLGSSDSATRTGALRRISIDVQQVRDYKKVDGLYDWQEGASWTAADDPLHTAVGTENSSVSVLNNTNAGIYSVSGGTSGGQASATLDSSSSAYGTAVSLSGQSVECIEQGDGSDPAGFSLLNGWDIQDNLPPGVLPAGDTVTEEVNADDSLGTTGLGIAENAAAGAIDVGLSVGGYATPGVNSAFWAAAAVMEPLGKIATIASGVPIAAIVGLVTDLVKASKNSCNAYPNVFNLTAAEPGGSVASYSWADQAGGLLQNYSTSYGDGENNPDGTAETNNVQLAPSTGIASFLETGQPATVHPYLSQYPALGCGSGDHHESNQCIATGASSADNLIDVDWAQNDPCPSSPASNCAVVPSSLPEVSLPGTSLCGTDNALCPVLAAPVPAASQTASASDIASHPSYSVLAGVTPKTPIYALTTVNAVAYAGGQGGGLYQFTPSVTTLSSGGNSTSTSSNFKLVWADGGSPIDSLVTVNGKVYVGDEKGGFFAYTPGGSGAVELEHNSNGTTFFDSTSYIKYMAVAGEVAYLATSNNQVWAYDVSSGQLSEVDINSWPAGGGHAGPSGQSINAMAASTSDLVIGMTGGYVYTCSIADGDCSTSHSMTQIDDGGFNSNVNALTLVGDTLYIGLENGAFVQQTLTQGDGSNTVIYNGTPENNPVKTNSNPDSIAGVTSADGNVYFGGCLGIVDPVTSDFVGVTTYDGSRISPPYNGCTNPTNANVSEYQGFDAASNQYALVASTPSSPGGPTVVYVAGHISSGNYVEALENLLPFTTSTCLNNVAPCPTKASPTAAVQSPPASAPSLGSLSSPQIQSECGGNSATGGSYAEIPPTQTTASGASIAGDGFQLKAAASTTESCSTTFAWNLNNAGTFPYGTWSSNAYLDAADPAGANLSLTVGGAVGQTLVSSSLPANGTTSVSATGEQLSVPLTGLTALVLTLTTPANSASSDVLDFTNDTLTPAGQPAPTPAPLSDGTPATTTATTTG